MDQLTSSFENIEWSEDLAIRKYSPAQQMEHKYNAQQEESALPTQYLPWKEVFEQQASERFPGKCPWDHATELKEDFKPRNVIVALVACASTQRVWHKYLVD